MFGDYRIASVQDKAAILANPHCPGRLGKREKQPWRDRVVSVTVRHTPMGSYAQTGSVEADG